MLAACNSQTSAGALLWRRLPVLTGLPKHSAAGTATCLDADFVISVKTFCLLSPCKPWIFPCYLSLLFLVLCILGLLISPDWSPTSSCGYTDCILIFNCCLHFVTELGWTYRSMGRAILQLHTCKAQRSTYTTWKSLGPSARQAEFSLQLRVWKAEAQPVHCWRKMLSCKT